MDKPSAEEPADRATEQEAPQPLTELLAHDCCVVTEVLAQDNDVQRLMSMGVCAGRTIEVVKNGDPLILKVFGSRIGVSARLAERVQVVPCPPGTY
jgi:Fe2+ transport system protein FeoA